jgi:DNA adenine methylase
MGRRCKLLRFDMKPFLKWPGGKRWLVSKYSHLFPEKFETYIEPFLGSGSVFFYLLPQKAILGDANAELMATYSGLRDDPFAVEDALLAHEMNHCGSYYYSVRDSRPRTSQMKAARFIYLNRTCFNGIYRVNRDGEFNVPKGTKSAVLFDDDDFDKASEALSRAQIHVSDFEALVDKAGPNDFIFADPPYTVRHNSNAFIKYNENLFSWTDQVRLADALARARDRGSEVMVTNANHHAVRSLYKDRSFFLRSISRFSSISADPRRRNQFEELIVLSEPKSVETRSTNDNHK